MFRWTPHRLILSHISNAIVCRCAWNVCGIVGVLSGKPNSLCRFLNQQASHAASDRAMYSASVDDSAIISCFLDHHVIAPPAAKKTYPDVDLQSSVLAYATSANLIKEFTGMFGILYVIPYDLVPDKYCNSLLRIPICCKLGFAVYDTSLFTVNAISGRVTFARYWSSPMLRFCSTDSRVNLHCITITT